MPVSRRPRILAGLATLLAALALGAPAAAQITSATLSSGGSSCTLTNCVTVPMTNRAGLGIDITGSGTWTVVFEGLKGAPGTATWRQVPYTDDSSPTTVATTSVTSEGSFTIANLGYTAIRVRASSYTSGTPVVSLTPSAGVGGGGGAGGTVTANAGTNLNTSALLTEAAFETVFGTSSLVSADPCEGAAKSIHVINTSTATTVEIANAVSGQYFYICAINIVVAGAQTVAIVEDDTDGVGSPTAGLNGGTSAATGWSFAANGGLMMGNGQGTIMRTSTTNRYLGIITGSAVQTSGTITYVSAP